MSDLQRGITPVNAVSLRAHSAVSTAAGRSPQQWPQDSQLRLTVSGLLADGSVRFEGEGLQLLLRHWPAALPLPANGSSWLFRVLVAGTQPQLQLQWNAPAATEGEGSAVAASPLAPVFRPAPSSPVGLAASYREAVLGRLAAAAAQFHHEAGQHLSGSMLALVGDLTMASLRQPPLAITPFPLSLPLWLWGGPVLQLEVEDPLPEAEDDVPPLDLLWRLSLNDGTQLHGRLRWQPRAIWLDVWGDAAAQAQFAAIWPQAQAKLTAAGMTIDLHLGAAPRMGGVTLAAHGISLFEPTRLMAELFQAAAILFDVLCPVPVVSAGE